MNSSYYTKDDLKLKLNQIMEYFKQKDNNLYNLSKAKAAIEAIIITDYIILNYSFDQSFNKAEILSGIYSLFQGLFVAIDGMYDLSKTVTKHKYHININANPVLLKLKFIRNDVVGHPTNRIYPDGSVGFSIIDYNVLTASDFIYNTNVFKKINKTYTNSTLTTKINIQDIITSFKEEQKLLIDELTAYFSSNIDYKLIADYLFDLLSTCNNFEINDKINDLEQNLQIFFHFPNNSHNRILSWINYYKLCLTWKTNDKALDEVITYIKKSLIKKIYEEITCKISNYKKHPQLKLKIPKLMVLYYRFIKKHGNRAHNHCTKLKNIQPEYFNNEVDALIYLNPSENVLKMLNYFKNIQNNDKKYLFSKILTSPRKEKTKNMV